MRQKLAQVLNLCLIVSIICIPFVAEASNLYSIIAADTLDKSIGKSVLQDYNHMRLKLQEIANYTGLDLKEISINGIDNKPSNLLKKLRDADIQNDDVVVFYYAGHGYRTEDKGSSPWPNLYFSKWRQGVEYETVMDTLNSKNPRFLLTIVDICNSYLDDDAAPPPLVTRATTPQDEMIIQENYRHLFLEQSGRIYVTSSKPGEPSAGYKDGGLYTNAFLRSLTAEVKARSESQWQTILAKAYSFVKSTEHPYSEVSLE